MSEEFITLSMTDHSSSHPTLTVSVERWQQALQELANGGKPVIYGSVGGVGCRGGSIPGRMTKVTLLEEICSEELLQWKAEDSLWGDCWLLSEIY
jgi:hypothetical protein